MRRLVLSLITFFTKKPRYIPSVEWSKQSWTHNVFRGIELIVGRSEGIRRESSVAVRFEGGHYVEYVRIYTIEALFAYFETYIRFLLKKTFLPVQLVSVNLLRLDGQSLSLPWIVFAIGFDASAVGTTTSTSPITGTHTCTGSNLMLAVGGGNFATTPTISTPTYAGVSMSLVGAQQTNTGAMAAMYFLTGPATGANTVSMAFGGTSPNCNYNSVSYTGVKQTGQPDASGGGTGASAPNPNWNTVADNCWAICVVSAISVSGGNQHALGGVLTLSGTHQMEVQDHNVAITPGGSNITFAWSATTTTWAGEGGSFAPFLAATTPTTGTPLLLMGVGS